MIRMLVPLAGIAVFFLLSLVTVRTWQPRQPRLFFLAYALLLLAAAAYVYVVIWPLESLDDGVGLLACLLLQLLMCLTMWNSFYSLLWGFSGGLMHDLYNEEDLRHVDRLVRSYERGPSAAAALGTPSLKPASTVFWRDVFPTSRPADTSSCRETRCGCDGRGE